MNTDGHGLLGEDQPRGIIGRVINYLKIPSLRFAMILDFKHAKRQWKRVAL
jgi:hypothetical protein